MTDQANAKVAEDAGVEQEPNRFETGWDSQEVSRTARSVERIAAGWGDRSQAIKVLRVLCHLTEEEPDRLKPDGDPDRWGFLATEVLGGMVRFNTPGADQWSKDHEKAKNRMKAHWPTIEKTWQRQAATIADGLEAEGLSLQPRLHRAEGGGTGKSNRYGFQFDNRNDMTENTRPTEIDLLRVAQVHYRRAHISGNRFVHWLWSRSFHLAGWGGRIYLAFAFAALLGVVSITWIYLIGMSAAGTALTFLKAGLGILLILSASWLVFGWLVRLTIDRVTLAPAFLDPLSKETNYLLEVRESPEAQGNAISLVRYVANCPLCGAHGLDKIHVGSGRLEFFGRLVGRCDRAPNAHVFSFDHVTQRGRFLR